MIRKVLTSRALRSASKISQGLYSLISIPPTFSSPLLLSQSSLHHRLAFSFSDDKNKKKPETPKEEKKEDEKKDKKDEPLSDKEGEHK